jgi:hypothetical protein
MGRKGAHEIAHKVGQIVPKDKEVFARSPMKNPAIIEFFKVSPS